MMRWCLGEVIQSRGWDHLDKINSLVRKDKRTSFLSLYHVKTQDDDHVQTRKSALIRDQISTLALEYSASQTVRNKCLLCKMFSLWYPVTAK